MPSHKKFRFAKNGGGVASAKILKVTFFVILLYIYLIKYNKMILSKISPFQKKSGGGYVEDYVTFNLFVNTMVLLFE